MRGLLSAVLLAVALCAGCQGVERSEPRGFVFRDEVGVAEILSETAGARTSVYRTKITIRAYDRDRNEVRYWVLENHEKGRSYPMVVQPGVAFFTVELYAFGVASNIICDMEYFYAEPFPFPPGSEGVIIRKGATLGDNPVK